MFIVNAPFVVKALWAVMAPWVDPLTKAKFIWGKDKLAEYIEKDQLPKFLGGTCKCREGKCLKVPFVSGRETTSDFAELGLIIPLPRDDKVITSTDEKDRKLSSTNSSSSSSSSSSTSSSSSSTSSTSSSSSSSSTSSAEKKDEKDPQVPPPAS